MVRWIDVQVFLEVLLCGPYEPVAIKPVQVKRDVKAD